MAKGKLLKEFQYTGNVQTIELLPGKYYMECYGAQGGGSDSNTSLGCKGGYVYGEYVITTKTKLYIFVGGRGTNGNGKIDSAGGGGTVRNYGGYNGGGRAVGGGAGGGGMTHISTTNNLCPKNSNGGWNPTGTLLVAGGGGGNSASTAYYGFSSSGYQGTGGNACTNRHSNRYPNDESGGGAGWYGGAVIHGDDPRASYSGQNYISSLFTNTSNQYDIRQGNGYCAIYYIGHVINTIRCNSSHNLFIGGEEIKITATQYYNINGYKYSFRRFDISDNLKELNIIQWISDKEFTFIAPTIPLTEEYFITIKAIYGKIRTNSNYYKDSYYQEHFDFNKLIGGD